MSFGPRCCAFSAAARASAISCCWVFDAGAAGVWARAKLCAVAASPKAIRNARNNATRNTGMISPMTNDRHSTPEPLLEPHAPRDGPPSPYGTRALGSGGPRTFLSAHLLRLDRHEADKNVRGPSNSSGSAAIRKCPAPCRSGDESHELSGFRSVVGVAHAHADIGAAAALHLEVIDAAHQV